ncbi:hypothetical protein [Photobacterium damselae]|uniref:hypothetical protein n=1 Tax=Photobacterium damselae TaxID=38293 RepID=UPI001F39A671|nr:hypothetical protein [Photobacterium damselae]UKA05053.1 hypothetical protein IHC89_22665 [Photobacterium damselae subsp. damselae]
MKKFSLVKLIGNEGFEKTIHNDFNELDERYMEKSHDASVFVGNIVRISDRIFVSENCGFSNKRDIKILENHYDDYEHTIFEMMSLLSRKTEILKSVILSLVDEKSAGVSSDLFENSYNKLSLSGMAEHLEVCLNELNSIELSSENDSDLLIYARYKLIELNIFGIADSIDRYLALNAYWAENEVVTEYKSSLKCLIARIKASNVQDVDDRTLHGDIIEVVDILTRLDECTQELISEDFECEIVDVQMFADEDDSVIEDECGYQLTTKSLSNMGVQSIDELCDYLRVCCDDVERLREYCAGGGCSFDLAEFSVQENVCTCLVAMRSILSTMIVKENGFQQGMIANLQIMRNEVETATKSDADVLFICADICLAHSRALHRESLKRESQLVGIDEKIKEVLDYASEYNSGGIFDKYSLLVEIVDSVMDYMVTENI